MLTLSCHCGQIRIEITRQPDYINECNCTLCSKAGARWAYFHPSDVNVTGATTGYCREDKADPAAEIRFCAHCGSTTHFVLTASAASKFGNTMMGVNMRLADESDLAGMELRYPDGQAWSGEGEFGYVREAHRIGQPA
ncbi:GFA family protein [Novosphingobium album (ex Liu et al. 2023)]|uniref:Aldehyde-activating protein n=1 Tax=Novosphingobium album (ex Liu et al. 2023) TaxID=3031130 RepID=A0ABT5WJZ5_9SPHN|nr:aldehyde-activating protein [Novosphingobium album (ex Liu et al. 2023)]MDE8650364.1 aldehyde-activating protein [Novosphingobium album (ex Liu et al. 2023)]